MNLLSSLQLLAVGAPEANISPASTLRWALVIATLLVLINGFFVAAEFALVKVRPTQIQPPPRRATAGQAGAADARPPRRLPLGEPAGHHAREPGARLDRPTGLRVDPAPRPRATGARTGPPLDQHHPGLPDHHPPAHRARRAGPQVDRHPQEPSATALDRVAALRLLQADLPGHLAAQHDGHRPAAADRPPAGNRARRGHSEDELRLLLAHTKMEHQGQLKRELLDNVFELSHRIARQIMVPRADVVYLSIDRGPRGTCAALARAATPASRSATATSTR